MNRALARLLRRHAGVESGDALARVLEEAAAATPGSAVSPELRQLLAGLRELLARIEAEFDQRDRDLDLRSRSLELMSEELVGANEQLRRDLASRNRVLEALRESAAALLAAGGGQAAVPASSDLEGLSALLPVLIRRLEANAAAVAESERKFANLYANTPVMLHSTDEAGVITRVNDYWLAQLGYRREEVVGHDITEFMTPESRRQVVEELRPAYRATGFCKDVALQFVRKDGALVDVLLSAYKESGPDGTVVSLDAMVDVTERRRAQTALTETHERLQRALEASRLALWDLDFETGVVYLSEAWSEMLGGPWEPTVTTFEALTERVPEEDRAGVWEAMVPALKGLVSQYSVEHRVLRPDGRTIWILSQGRAIERDASGRARRAVGTNRDITERRRREEALQLAALVYQHSSEAMMVSDADNRIVAINPAFTALTGYEAKDVVGENPRILRSGRQGPEFYRALWETLNATGRWQGELWNRHKDGHVFAESLSINTIRHASGAVRWYVALFSDITEKKEAESLIWQQANFDALTTLPNRRMFRDRLEQDVKKARRDGTAMAILFIDLDRFKEVNDTLGHDKGDLLLIEAARRIRECVRASDTVARLGGDEFTVAITDLEDTGRVQYIAQAIIDALAGAFTLGLEKVYVTASIGITLFPEDANEIHDLFRHADQALYAAKAAGRNRFSYYTPELQVAALERMRLTNDMREALAREQFSLHFQPVVDLATGRVRKAEALIRWHHPALGLVSPGQFIPLAEASGLIVEIGGWVFREAARWARRWRDSGLADFQVSVNQSPREFQREGRAFTERVAFLQQSGLPGQGIAVEITEGLLLDASPDVKAKLLELRDAGIEVAIDDFGTGYSSLAYLKNLHIDYLKIDQSFTRNLAAGSSDLALTEAMIVMAHKLGIKVIAEGVESAAQRDLLRAAGCDYGQGNLFAAPMAADAFERFLAGGPRLAAGGG